MSSPLRIAHITHGMGAWRGGPAKSVPGLAAAQERIGAEVAIFAVRHRLDEDNVGQGSLDLRLADPGRLTLRSYAPDLLPQVLGWRPDIIHSHGLWTYVSWAAGRAARKLGVPHVCAPRGMLDPWALKRKRWQKYAVTTLYQRDTLESAQCLHALADAECQAMRAFGLSNPVAVVPNGVDASALRAERSSTRLHGRYPHLAEKHVLLFLSRLHPKKGIIELIRAWAQLAREARDWHLALAGPNVGEYRAVVERAVRVHGVQESVSLLGPQNGEEIWDCYFGADIFVLPSHSEGLSMAVLEALACGLPVCITPACHFDEVEASGCGIVCEPSPPSLAAALGRLMAAMPEKREAMGQAGRNLVRARYTWDWIAAEMMSVYEWTLSPSGPLPPAFGGPPADLPSAHDACLRCGREGRPSQSMGIIGAASDSAQERHRCSGLH